MLNVMLSAVMLNFVKLSVIMLSVVAPGIDLNDIVYIFIMDNYINKYSFT